MQQLWLVLAALALVGCSGEPDGDLQDWVQAERTSAKPRITPLTEPKQFVPQEYKVGQGGDPFSLNKLTQALRRESARNVAGTSLIAPEHSRRKEELEAFPLDTMTMMGSLDRQGKKTALLRVEKLLYQVRAGQYLGQNYGRIVQVTENSIQLRELIQDASGDWVEKMTTLDLQEGKK